MLNSIFFLNSSHSFHNKEDWLWSSLHFHITLCWSQRKSFNTASFDLLDYYFAYIFIQMKYVYKDVWSLGSFLLKWSHCLLNSDTAHHYGSVGLVSLQSCRNISHHSKICSKSTTVIISNITSRGQSFSPHIKPIMVQDTAVGVNKKSCFIKC